MTFTIKLLEWHGPDVNDEIYARSVLCIYRIQKQRKSMGFWLTEVGGNFQSIEEAKAAAEADYRQRILSTLSLPAQEPIRRDGWRQRLEDLATEIEIGNATAAAAIVEELLEGLGDVEEMATIAPQPEAVITEEMVERVAAKLRSSVFPGKTATNLARELLEAAMKEA